MLKIRKLSLKYSSRFNLFIDRLDIGEGNILAVIGPNGAGKTTLLNIIAMFDKPESGSIELSGQNIFNGKAKVFFRRKMSFVFSQPYLLNRSVYDNVALPLRLRGIYNSHSIDRMLELFRISHLTKDNAISLSQGERHRVALARAFVIQPKLLLLDEPFSSLEANYKQEIMDELRKMIRLNRITTIFVTQDLSEAMRLADIMAVMKNGRILQDGPPEDIFKNPVSADVAEFIGDYRPFRLDPIEGGALH